MHGSGGKIKEKRDGDRATKGWFAEMKNWRE